MTLTFLNAADAYYPGRSLVGLCASEMFVMASVRLWVAEQAPPCPQCPDWPDWRRGMEVAGLKEDAAAAFDLALRLIGTCARHPLKVHTPPCGRLGAGEVLLLSCIKSAQAEAYDTLRATLSTALCPTGVRLASEPLVSFAQALREVGLVLPARAASSPVAIMAPVDRGHALVH